MKKPEFSEDARREITLLYLEEALYKEQYEDCGQIIQNAKRFGAGPDEVSKVIARFLKNRGKRPQREAEPGSAKSAGITGLRRF